MLPKSLLRTLKSKRGFDSLKVPKNYTLGTGHGYFFYDKLNYIYKRFELLKQEMIRRGYACNSVNIVKIEDKRFLNDWEPNEDDIETNRRRIKERIESKPHLYKN